MVLGAGFMFCHQNLIILLLLAVREGLTHPGTVELIKKLESYEEELGKMMYCSLMCV